ncbi:hypothetical protein GQ53DRAFT_532357 [Thozetella sp. PMI_491]|nr:hypothetical protein GQ53DRAFT_532357 [Thozetella sp. PMI_491]
MSSATTSGSSSPIVSAPSAVDEARLRSAIESGVKFQIKTGNSKWQCTILDRNTHERQKAARTNSTASVSTDSGSSIASH